MNFISMLDTAELAVDLKYCERCGGLWIRARGKETVYCRRCEVQIAQMPRPKRRYDVRRRKESQPEPVRMIDLLGVAEEVVS